MAYINEVFIVNGFSAHDTVILGVFSTHENAQKWLDSNPDGLDDEDFVGVNIHRYVVDGDLDNT